MLNSDKQLTDLINDSKEKRQQFVNQASFQTVKQQKVAGLLLALGSNHDAEKNLAYAKEALAKYGKVLLSGSYINPDYTATKIHSKPMYTNQCAIIALTDDTTLEQFVAIIKRLELKCDRQHQTANVSLDVDILAVSMTDAVDFDFDWLALAERYPFKAHEWVGVEALMTQML